MVLSEPDKHKTIYVNPDFPGYVRSNLRDAGIRTTAGCVRPSVERALAHEMGHALGYHARGSVRIEMLVIKSVENPVAEKLGQPERISHDPCKP